MTGHQIIIRAVIKDLESQHGASAVLPITEHLSRADEALRKMYQRQAAVAAERHNCVREAASERKAVEAQRG